MTLYFDSGPTFFRLIFALLYTLMEKISLLVG